VQDGAALNTYINLNTTEILPWRWLFKSRNVVH